jgi:hypothetical protein
MRKIKRKNREMVEAIRLFFEQMDRFLSQRHNITPVALVDTMAEPEKMDHHSDSLDDDQSLGLQQIC